MSTTVNRCPHVGGPEDADCGCPLDFDCTHGGQCETEDECNGRDDGWRYSTGRGWFANNLEWI